MNALRKVCFITITIALAGCGGGGSSAPGTGPGNLLPVARFSANPVSGAVPVTVQFDSTASTDSDGSITSYTWDFGDGSTGSGDFPSHEYTQSGVITVRLTVTDNSGGQNSTTILLDFGQPTGGAWLGEYESSLIEPAPPARAC